MWKRNRIFSFQNDKAFDDDKDGRLTEEEFTTIAGSLISSLFLTFSHVCLDNATSENLPRKGLYDIHFVHRMSRYNPGHLMIYSLDKLWELPG